MVLLDEKEIFIQDYVRTNKLGALQAALDHLFMNKTSSDFMPDIKMSLERGIAWKKEL
jgi:hypothetical protein